MQFPDSFFEDEIRDGFYIPALMKRAWAAQMEVLEDVAKVCKKHHIRWFADYGTLLGAVRHGGHIPWDDDLDICMLRDDYILFNQIAEKELSPAGYYIPQNRSSEYRLLTPLLNCRSISIEKAHLDKFHGFPFRTGVDIFPLDYAAPSSQDEEFRTELIKIMIQAHDLMVSEYQNADRIMPLLTQIEELLHVTFDRDKPLEEQIFSMTEMLFCLYSREEASEVIEMPYYIGNPKYKYPLMAFMNPVKLPFETIEIPAPSCYDKILRAWYGDYMQYNRSGNTHDYPFYEGQKRVLFNALGKDKIPFQFLFSADSLKKRTDSGPHRPEMIRESTAHDNGKSKRREAVFLPFRASHWESMESCWRALTDEANIDVYVIPIPYSYRNWDGSLKEMQWDGSLFPDYVPVSDYKSYDFTAHRPDFIFIQNPYDDCNPTVSVHPFFYSVNLKRYTDNLVYIPFFTLDETQPDDIKAEYQKKYYITMPGVVYADTVIVQSEMMRQAYIHYLTKTAGNSTKKLWEEKITCNFQIPFLKMK